MIRLHYSGTTILGAYPDDEMAPTPNILANAGDWQEFDTIENGQLVHNGKPLSLAKAEKKAELDAAYDAAANADVTYNGNTFQADKAARENLEELSVYRGTGGSLPVDFTWRTKANTNVAFTWTDVDGIITAIATQKFVAVANMHTKKDALEAAATVAEVNAITW